MKRVLLFSTATMLAVSGFTWLASAQTAPKPAAGSDAQPVAVMLEQGIYQEETAGNLEAAAKTYRQIVEQAAVGRALVAQALARLAALEVRQKQLDEARQTIERLKTEYPEQKDLIAKAEALLPNNGTTATAKTEKHVPTAEEKAEAAELTKQGWDKYRDGQFRLAEDLFRRSETLNPDSADTWTGWGWSMMNTNPLTGQNQFAHALQLDPNNAMALNGMGWANSHLGSADEKARTLDYWRRAVEADPTATSPMRGLAQNAYQNADFDEAIKWYEKWLALDLKNADAIAGLELAKQGQAAVKEANIVVTDFFKKLDDDQYSETRDLTTPNPAAAFASGNVSGRTKAGVAYPVAWQEWIEFLKKYRGPLGKTIVRKIKSVQYTSDRRSVGPILSSLDQTERDIIGSVFRGVPSLVLQFNTTYENKRNVIEDVALEKRPESGWKITDYVVLGAEAPRDPLRD